MPNIMEQLYKNKNHKTESLNISQDKSTHQFISRSDASKPKGLLKEEVYDLYYDNDNTITTALDTTPPGGRINDSENVDYNQEEVFTMLERNAPFLWVTNDAGLGGPVIYVIAAHTGTGHFSRERPIYPKEVKVYKNIFELRLRCAVAGTPYRVSEYEIDVP